MRSLRSTFVASPMVAALLVLVGCPRRDSESGRPSPATESRETQAHSSNDGAHREALRGPRASRSLSFYTEYHQFYLADPSAEFDTGAESFWTPEASARGLAVGDGGIGVSTASFGRIRAFLELADREPTMPLEPWDRVVEGSFHVASGRFVIASATGFDVEVEAFVSPGDYRARVFEAFTDEEVEGTSGDDYFDFYWIVVWPAPSRGPELLTASSAGR